jgi:hypothetical protein
VSQSRILASLNTSEGWTDSLTPSQLDTTVGRTAAIRFVGGIVSSDVSKVVPNLRFCRRTRVIAKVLIPCLEYKHGAESANNEGSDEKTHDLTDG